MASQSSYRHPSEGWDLMREVAPAARDSSFRRNDGSYGAKRASLTTYFDRTAARAWEQLTSDGPVSRVRATVRAGRERMRDTLLSWLPADLTGLRILDAGCGTGALAVEAARRGAQVVAIDVAANLVEVAARRAREMGEDRNIEWRVGDMLDASLGRFDHVVAMDSLIHYSAFDIVAVLAELSERIGRGERGSSLLFTFAPSTPALAAMHRVGKLFPRSDRSPAIEPVRERLLRTLIGAGVPGVRIGRSERVSGGFYTSQALELVKGELPSA